MSINRALGVRTPVRRNILLGCAPVLAHQRFVDEIVIEECPLLDNLGRVLMNSCLSVAEMSERYAIAEQGAIRAMSETWR